MKINFIGNTCNNHYVIAKFLRRAGIDAHLYYPLAESESSVYTQQQPTAEDSDLIVEEVEWLHPYPVAHKFTLHHRIKRNLLNRIKQCDILHVHDYGLTWAAQTGKPVIWHPFGSDLYKYPFFHLDSLNLGELRRALSVRAMRFAVKQASRIIIGEYNRQWQPGYKMLSEMEQWFKAIALPLMIDASKFKPSETSRQWPESCLSHALNQSDLVIFHPTRQLFTPKGLARSGIDSSKFKGKANDVLYRAIAQLVHQHGANVIVVVIDKGDFDTPAAKGLIQKLGIKKHVYWIPKMERYQLIAWYQAADMVVNSLFASHQLGSISLEAMACGTPLMMKRYLKINENDGIPLSCQSAYEEEPPVINVNNELDIVNQIMFFIENKHELNLIGKKSRRWVLDHVDGQVLVNRYIELYKQVLAEKV